MAVHTYSKERIKYVSRQAATKIPQEQEHRLEAPTYRVNSKCSVAGFVSCKCIYAGLHRSVTLCFHIVGKLGNGFMFVETIPKISFVA